MRILVVEDDALLGESLVSGLKREAYAVDWAKSAKEAESILAVTESYSCILLDLNLPDKYGLDLLSDLRARKDQTPVIVVTARDQIDDRIQGLDTGADDYMVKPFDINEVFARLRSITRRANQRTESVIVFEDISLDPATHMMSIADENTLLKNREFMVLQLLMDNAGKFVSKDDIRESIYDWDDEIGSNAVEVHISNLRKKIGKNRIKMLRNIGYRLEKAES